MFHVRYDHIVDVQSVSAALRRMNPTLAMLPPDHALALDDVSRARRRAVVHVDLRRCWDR
jgi:hypothetical protein